MGAGVVVDHEGAAAETGALRLDQAQHRLHRDRRIDGRAALAQHLDARRHRQRIGRRHHGMGFGRGLVDRRRRLGAGGPDADKQGENEGGGCTHGG